MKWYQVLFDQGRFWVALQNNLKWLILGVIPTVALAIFLAYVLELAPFPAVESYTRTLILYPVAMSFIVTGTIWSWIYEPGRGVVNTILGGMGIDSPLRFTTNPTTATYWLILVFIWQDLGFAVIIIQSSFRTAELQEMVEAATVDGASKPRILFSVIIPNIRSHLALVSLLLISSLKVFDIVYIVTFGGPGISTDAGLCVYGNLPAAPGFDGGIGMIPLAFILVIPYTLYALNKWFE
jgi:ABC-type sugar transport system permease subunit